MGAKLTWLWMIATHSDEESAAENGDALMDVEEDAAMDEDDADAATAAAAKAAKRIKAAAKGGDGVNGETEKADDDDELAAYNLDTYDEESSSTGAWTGWRLSGRSP